jgi:hypothetical protein
MNAWTRRGTLAGLLGLALGSVGCSLGSLAYFLTPEQKLPPELHSLVSPDNKQQVKVVILATTTNPVVGTGLIGVDRELGQRVATQLHALCQANQENVLIINPRGVEDFKRTHDNWRDMHPAEIGQKFKADYVINLDINNITLMEKGNFSDLYRGRAEMSISLVDVHKPDNSPDRAELSDVYPDEARPVPVTDMPLPMFRTAFLERIAKRVAWHFAAHPREAHQQDPRSRLGVE